MRIYRFIDNGVPRFGLRHGEMVRRSRAGEIGDAALPDQTLDGQPLRIDELWLLPPVVPTKIVAIGRNYAEHARELGNEAPSEPLIFLKPPSALLAHGDTIELPPQSHRVDYEAELAIVIGRRARKVPESAWREYVLGFTCANDVTARDLQKKDVQFTRGKGFDTFAPLGPCVVTDLDVSDIGIVARVNGEVRQDGRTSQMIFPPGALVEFVSHIMTLEPGDLILTGTPAGVGPLVDGDTVEVEIEGIGVLRNTVVRR